MTKLIQLKNRIKSIKVIRKITKAMRLISISSHSKLKNKFDSIKNFKEEIISMICSLDKSINKTKIESTEKKTLYLIFASEKELCGNFNNIMFEFFDEIFEKKDLSKIDIISIGRKVLPYLEKKKLKSIHHFNNPKINEINNFVDKLYDVILLKLNDYDYVKCLYSYPKTFFKNYPKQKVIYPIYAEECELKEKINYDSYVWIQEKKDVIDYFYKIFLKINLSKIITSSMLSEQSFRFISMDSATRNAENLIKVMNLNYNKARQAKITKELIELTFSF